MGLVHNIRFDLEEQRLSLPDVLVFTLGFSLDKLVERTLRLARKNGLSQLAAALERTPRHPFKRREPGSKRVPLPYIGCPTEFIQIFTELLNQYRSTRGCERTQVLPRLWCNLKQFHSEFKGCFPTLWNSAHCATHNVAPLNVNAEAQYDIHGAVVTTSNTTKVTPSLCMPSCSRRTTTYEAVLTCMVMYTHSHIPSLPYQWQPVRFSYMQVPTGAPVAATVPPARTSTPCGPTPSASAPMHDVSPREHTSPPISTATPVRPPLYTRILVSCNHR